MFGPTQGGEAVRKAISRRCIQFGLILCFGGLPLWAKDGRSLEVFLTVAVHNRADIPANTLGQAELTASAIFKEAGVEVDWVNCEPSLVAPKIAASCGAAEFRKQLQLTIARRSKNLTDSIFGISYLDEDGSGCYSNVFFEPAEELHERLHVDLGTLLGHVVAHEIAHLLLGRNAHSDTGIMRPHWDERDLANASKGALLFTRAQGQTMRERLAASLSRTARPLVRAAAGRD
jgi:hypothetical protein